MHPPTVVLETPRLVLRRFTLDDAPFVFEMVNDPDWIRYIGDRGVRTLDDARAYIRDRTLAQYDRVGFGMYVVSLVHGGEVVGSCGLIRRESLEDVDIGFAFLARHRGQGYATEAAAAVLEYGVRSMGLTRIVAIVSPDNHRSIRILERIGMRYERMVRLPGEEEEIPLYAYKAPDAAA
ncbi:MAG TPA: GNAT family N-acetyltransferase [Candidatus Omnitrophota bacterium]|nr:GNAT family N-acetyltransferase [Candidatus Omnitrophota bacterium]